MKQLREIGIREAKARLSQVLHDVQDGTEWLITDRGKPIARIVPIDLSSLTLRQRLKILEERGVLAPSSTVRSELTPPAPLRDELAQRWLQEDRDGRR